MNGSYDLTVSAPVVTPAPRKCPQTANRLDPSLCSRFTDEEALKLAKLLWNSMEVFLGRDRIEARRRERSEG